MGKRGPKPKNIVNTRWSANLAYAVGLLTTDGCLYKDGRRIAFVSKDLEQVSNFKQSLGLDFKIGKVNSNQADKKAYRIQINNVCFYSFLLSIGLTPVKSKTISSVKLPKKYFFDFLRGCYDGDGCFYSYWDSRWKSSHMFYLDFTSASIRHLYWLQSLIFEFLGIWGYLKLSKKGVCSLRYAKKDSVKIIKRMYKDKCICLSRKFKKIEKALLVEKKQQMHYK